MTTGMIIPAAMASSVDVSVVDVTAPTGSVSLAPGGSGAITINMVVTGNQAGALLVKQPRFVLISLFV